jgi:outer membrane murein-binding lipoprotein Lpp
MTGTSTGARNTRPARTAPGAGRTGRTAARSYGTYVDGSSALQIGYAEGFETEEVESRYAAPAQGGDQTRDAASSRRRAVGSVPQQRQRTRSGPAVTSASAPSPVAAPLPVSLPRASFLVLIVALVVAGVVGVLVLTTKINENAFELDNLRAQQAELNQQEQQLAQQLADKESTGNLAAEAARLGLVPAGTPAVVSLPDGRVVGLPQPAQARTATTYDPGR